MGHRTCSLAIRHGPWPGPSPQKRAGHRPGQRAFWGWARAGAHDVWPMSMSYVPWHVLCPMSHGPVQMSHGLVLCPMALSHVLWPYPMSYGPGPKGPANLITASNVALRSIQRN